MNPQDDALLRAMGDVTAEQERAACVTLASLSLAAAHGNKRAAKRMLCEALEIIGAVPYPRAHGKYHFGEVKAS